MDESQQTVNALLAGQVDAMVDTAASSVILLQEAQLAIRRLAAIVESSQDAIISLSIDGAVLTWNAAAEQLFGHSTAEAINHPLIDLIPPFSENEPCGCFALTSIEKCDRQFESVRRCKNGGPKAVSMSLSLVRDITGTVISISMIARDITVKLLEDEHRQSHRKLEAIGRLAAGVAHEMNTPIQFIGDNLAFLKSGFSRLIDRIRLHEPEARATSMQPVSESGDEDLSYLCSEIPNAIKESLDGVQRVASIIIGLREFSHPGSVEFVQFDLNAAIKSTITICRNEHRHIAEVITDLAEDIPLVMGRVNEIKQVILILIVNAAHAMSNPGQSGLGTIRISTKLGDDHIELRISDTGPGVPESVRPHLFEPFFTTKPIGMGTGQGLYIAHDIIVNRHQGQISYIPGTGATFLVEIPITVELASTPTQPGGVPTDDA